MPRERQLVGAGVIVVGVLLGVAIGGIPSRHHDPPLRVSTEGSTTSAAVPLTITTATTRSPGGAVTSPPTTVARTARKTTTTT